MVYAKEELIQAVVLATKEDFIDINIA